MDADRLRSLFHYDPETGVFTGISSRSVPSQKDRGYIRIWIDGKHHAAHRLAFLYVTGAWPTGVVDHLNRVRDDNRFSNLRDVTSSENAKNTKRRRLPRSKNGRRRGFRRLRWQGRIVYRAQIMVDGKSMVLGHFKTAKAANEAYAKAISMLS